MKLVTSVLMPLLLAFVASLVLVAAAPANPTATKQHVVLEGTKIAGPGGGTFTLTASGSGPLKADSGTFSGPVSQKKIVRNGQAVIIFTSTTTFKGKLGTLVLKERFEDVAAGNGYRVGTGVWSVVKAKGKRQYAGLTGSGRSAYVLAQDHHVFFRWEGFVTKP